MSNAVLVAPLNSSLSNWGFMAAATLAPPSLGGNSQWAVYPHGVTLHGGHVLNLHAFQSEQTGLDANFLASGSSGTRNFITLGMNVLFIMVCVALLLLCLLSSGDEAEETPGDKDALPGRLDFRDAQCSSGSWAQAYREAAGNDRDALELLFRCHIITTYEFAESRVSREHIDECIWIATYMLQQKPLSEWVAMREQAKKRFEESAVTLFQARAESRGTSPHHSNLSTPRHLTPLNSNKDLSNELPEVPSLPVLSASSSLSSMARARADASSSHLPPRQLAHVDAAVFEEKVQQVSFRPAIPRVKLDELSMGKVQSYREDDDDPYTTRDIY